MFSKKYLVAIATVSLAGCAGIDKVGAEMPLTAATRHAVEQAVANLTTDPNSAEFRNEHAFESQLGVLVCGEVNTRNSFGGYVGFTHFVAHASPDGQLLTRATLAANSVGGPDALIDAVWKGYYPGCYN